MAIFLWCHFLDQAVPRSFTGKSYFYKISANLGKQNKSISKPGIQLIYRAVSQSLYIACNWMSG